MPRPRKVKQETNPFSGTQKTLDPIIVNLSESDTEADEEYIRHLFSEDILKQLDLDDKKQSDLSDQHDEERTGHEDNTSKEKKKKRKNKKKNKNKKSSSSEKNTSVKTENVVAVKDDG